MGVRPSGYAWMGLAAYVAAVDILLLKAKKSRGHPYCSMSEGFGDALAHPIRRWLVIMVWAIVTLHLFGPVLPGSDRLSKYDPIGRLARILVDEKSSAIVANRI